MRVLLRRFRFIILIAVLVMFLVSYFGIYLPLKHRLENSLQHDYLHEFEIAELTFKNSVEQAITGARSLGSRTAIRQKMLAFVNGTVSLKEVREYTRDKYADGAGALNELKAAYRISRGQVIASYGQLESLPELNNRELKLNINQDTLLVTISSPVIDAGKLLGYDLLVFDINPTFMQMNYDDIHYSLQTREELEEMVGSLEQIEGQYAHFLYGRSDDDHIYAREIYQNRYLVLRLPDDVMYSSLEKFTMMLLPIYILTSLIIMGFIYYAMRRISRMIVNRLEEANQELNNLVRRDYLTGLYNRYTFEEIIEQEHQRAERYDSVFSLIMFDLDNFKRINDTYGHEEGDKVLKEVSQLIRKNTRKTDYACRWGGEEFFVITTETAEEEAVNLAERFRTMIYNHSFSDEYQIKASFGVASYRKGEEVKSLINRVDQALYQAKREGKNRVVLA